MALEDLARAADRLGGVLARDRVLHLDEAHEPRAGEHAERPVDPLTPRGRARSGAVEQRDCAREAPRGAVENAEHVVVDEHVLEPLADAAGRLARRLGAGVGARERERRVREGPELEVVGGVGPLVERGEHGPRAAPGASTPRRRNEGTQRSVTAATTPSAPSPTRAARSRSPSVSSISLPSPRTSSSRSTCADRFGSRAPVPCVPVASAPATDWTSISPRLGSARPRKCSSRLSRCSDMPASTRTSGPSASSTRAIRSSESSVPEVSTAAVNE